MSEKRTIYFYYANWCPHCVSFKPTWNKIKEYIDDPKNKLKSVSYEEYEDGSNPTVMQRDNINGFPTIKMKFGNKTIEYNGPRDFDTIITSLVNTSVDEQDDNDNDNNAGGQCGGG